MVGTSNQSVPEMAIEWTQRNHRNGWFFPWLFSVQGVFPMEKPSDFCRQVDLGKRPSVSFRLETFHQDGRSPEFGRVSDGFPFGLI